MPTFTASLAIRGAVVKTIWMLPWKLACASCTFGWLPFADHHAVMIGNACEA
jgi:hypothetical protein